MRLRRLIATSAPRIEGLNYIMARLKSPAQVLSEKLKSALRIVSQGITHGANTRPIIWGINQSGAFVKEMSPEKFIATARQLMIKSGKIYRMGNRILCERAGADGPELVTLAIDHRADPNASAQLSNFFLVGTKIEDGESRSFLPPPLTINLLSDAGLWESLPVIKHYSRRPIFAADFNLCQPGWNASSGIMVHSDAIEPGVFTPPDRPGLGPINYLPPRLSALLGEFSWRSDADLVNAVAFLLTGLLVNHFVDDPHPGVIVDGNQPGLGKTLLVQVVGQLMDNAEPPRIPLSRDLDQKCLA